MRNEIHGNVLSWRDWVAPGLLLLLAAVPAGGGVYRVATVVGDVAKTPDNARFLEAPVPILLHGVSVTLFAVLGAFQFPRVFRARWPRWHRGAGAVLVPAGLLTAASGLWMQATYELPAHDGALLAAFRWAFGGAMLVAILLGVDALRRRDFRAHGVWMTRGYALGMGAGTQVVTFLTWFLLVGEATTLQRALLMGGSWAINLVVAEWVLRRRAVPTRPAVRLVEGVPAR